MIGVWATASRRKSRVFDSMTGKYVGHGPWKQVSRLGNPLVNEVLIPMAEKDQWNARPPRKDSKFAKYVNKPELAELLPVLYPGAFPNLAAYNKPRADLNAILLTGIPTGVVPGLPELHRARSRRTCCGSTWRSRRRAAPTTWVWSRVTPRASPTGAGSTTTWSTIELRAIAGLTIPLVDPSYTAGRGGERRRGRHDEHQRGDHWGRSRTWACPVAATRPIPGTTSA